MILAIIAVIIVMSMVGFVILGYLHSRFWPVKYTITNEDKKSVEIKVFHNGIELIRSPITLVPDESTEIQLGIDPAINPRTNKQISRSETKSTSIYLSEDNKMSIKPSKHFPEYKTVISVDNSGLIPVEKDASISTWSQKGYYYIDFYNGVPVFSS